MTPYVPKRRRYFLRPTSAAPAATSAVSPALIWINFDRHGFLNLVNKMKGKFIANIDDIRPQFRADENAFLSQNAIFQRSLVRDNGLVAGATIDELSRERLDEVSGFKQEAKPWYSDQVLPFDITLAGTNEMAAATA